MPPETWGEVALLVACVVIASVASATETALTSVGRFRVRHLAEEGSRSGLILERLHQDPNRFLSTVLVVNTVALILASFATTLLSVRYVPAGWGFIGDLITSLILSAFLLIFAEVTPKSLALRNAERISLAAAPIVNALSRVLRPVIWTITIIARAVTGGRAAHAPYLTEEELMTLLHVSEEEGVIEGEEREMIHGIIEIGDKAVREVMVPRTDIDAIDRELSLERIIEIVRNSPHTRLPVFEHDLDRIVGVIHAKDLLRFLAQEPRPEFRLEQLMRPITYTPESKKVDELLHEMQAQRVHMVIVLDEYGGTAGLVTLEDLLEEIVGEIRDEYDVAEEEQLHVISETQAVVDARFSIAELNEVLELGVEESDDYDSVGGYVLATLGRFPAAGTTFQSGAVRWTVEAVTGYRILRVRLESTKPWPEEALIDAGLRAPEPRAARSQENREG
ncbi:MAG TPA: hemolysin family protein [Candidatus Dormibacteraeota bacterium]|jgi:CBS domain containing-hemolysin-like protein|nr:hemolysin family protein [Candidatus Dormibacteraeota bacterium]